jgi:hypothetical protein
MKIPRDNKPHWLRFVLALLVIGLLSSCTSNSTLRISSPAQLSRLPRSEGPEYTNVVTGSQWLYLGSTEQTHEFAYYYNRGDSLRDRRVTFPRSATKLEFDEVAYGSVRKWVVLDTEPSTFRFSIRPPRQPIEY